MKPLSRTASLNRKGRRIPTSPLALETKTILSFFPSSNPSYVSDPYSSRTASETITGIAAYYPRTNELT